MEVNCRPEAGGSLEFRFVWRGLELGLVAGVFEGVSRITGFLGPSLRLALCVSTFQSRVFSFLV